MLVSQQKRQLLLDQPLANYRPNYNSPKNSRDQRKEYTNQIVS